MVTAAPQIPQKFQRMPPLGAYRTAPSGIIPPSASTYLVLHPDSEDVDPPPRSDLSCILLSCHDVRASANTFGGPVFRIVDQVIDRSGLPHCRWMEAAELKRKPIKMSSSPSTQILLLRSRAGDFRQRRSCDNLKMKINIFLCDPRRILGVGDYISIYN